MAFLDRARQALRQLRDVATYTLHPWRRAAARRSLLRRPSPQRVLFVCHGNICRSPYAALAAARRFPNGGPPSCSSAGFIGPDRRSPSEAVDAAAARGVDLRGHRARLLTPAIVRAADLIVVMDPRQQADVRRGYGRNADSVLVLGDLDPRPAISRTITDPIDQPRTVFDDCYARIDRCLEVLVAALAAPRS